MFHGIAQNAPPPPGAPAGRGGPGAPPGPPPGPIVDCPGAVSATQPLGSLFNPTFVQFNGTDARDSFGEHVAVGDVNRDGFADVMIGATGKNKVYVYAGSATGASATPTIVLSGEGGEFGRSLISGDFNGDGYVDLIVGAHGFDAGLGTHQGKVYLFLGGPKGLSATPAQTLVGEHKGDEYGRTFALADMNGDGIKDLIVGASGYNGDLEYQGKVYVYKGTKTGFDPKPIFTAVGEHSNDEFGRSVGAADSRHDGHRDLIVGAPGLTRGGTHTTVPGAMYIYAGSAKGISKTPLKISGEAPGSHLGEGMAGVGDVNGDGFEDVAIGARDFSCGSGPAGKMYVYLGGPKGFSADRVWTVLGKGRSGLGREVQPAGDLNGDGYADFVTSGPVATAESGGGVYVFFGGPKGFGADPIIINAEGPSTGLGFGMGVGDINGDGVPDIAVGAPTGGDPKTGWARVYYGKPRSTSANKSAGKQ